MLEMIGGARIPFAEKLYEGYIIRNPWIWANVNASNMINVFRHFLDAEQNQSFSLFLEVPVSQQSEKELNTAANTAPNVGFCLS